MIERKSKPRTEKKCGVKNCSKTSKKSLPATKVKEEMPELKITEEGKRVHLCKKHYKKYKKKTKDDRELKFLGLRKPRQ